MFNTGFPPEWSTLKKLIWLVGSGIAGASYIWKTVTGTLIHITDALASPMQKCVVSLEPIQDLHGQDAPYPAGGGVNILPNMGNSGTPYGVSVSYDSENEIYTLDGTASSAGTIYFATIPDSKMLLSSGETYTISLRVVSGSLTVPEGTGNTYAVAVFGNSSNFIRGAVNLQGSGLDGYSATGTGFSASSDGKYSPLIQIFRAGIKFNNLKFHFQIEKGSSASPWQPYSNVCPITGWTGCEVWVKDEYDTSLPATLSVTFPSTVYGGKYEFVSGVGNDAYLSYLFDGVNTLVNVASAGWIGTEKTRCYLGRQPSAKYDAYGVPVYAKSNSAIYGNNLSDGKMSFIVQRSGDYSEINIYPLNSLTGVTQSDTANEARTKINAYFAEHPMQIVYEVAEPTEFSLTPQPISTLAGENNIWGDGTITAIYKAQSS